MYPILKRFSCSLPLRLARVAVALTLALVGLLPAQAAPLQADPVWQIQIVASTGAVGTHTSLDMSLDSRGYPVISYYDATNDELKLVRCGSPDCSTGNSIQTFAGTTTQHHSLVLDSNDNPVISYADSHAHILGDNLKLARCGSPDCASGNSIQIVDSGDWIGRFNSLALDSRGYPVISYSDEDTGVGYLKLVRCGSPDCATGNAIQIVDSAGDVGLYPSLALDSRGYPVISYYDAANGDLKLVQCGSPDCSTGNTIQTFNSAGDVGLTPSLLLDSNDNPIISYLDLTNRNLKLIRCSRPDCSGASSLQLVDGGGMVGLYNSLVLDSHGYPIISYFDNINRDLKLVRCGSPDCATGNAIQTVDSEDMVGLYPSLVLDSSGNPLISYFDNSYFALKLARQEATTIGRCAGYDAHHQGCSARNWSGGRPLRWL